MDGWILSKEKSVKNVLVCQRKVYKVGSEEFITLKHQFLIEKNKDDYFLDFAFHGVFLERDFRINKGTLLY